MARNEVRLKVKHDEHCRMGPARNRHFKSTHIGALTEGIENLLGNAAFDSADVISSVLRHKVIHIHHSSVSATRNSHLMTGLIC
ncbi:hypothetical protein TYRP_019299 [Tyrophagus putrescentiae]|nr:hypothetical protein TYRP_019299 [Tyrophagus putrescentiae]